MCLIKDQKCSFFIGKSDVINIKSLLKEEIYNKTYFVPILNNEYLNASKLNCKLVYFRKIGQLTS